MNKIKIYLGKEREIVEAELIEDRKITIKVKLPDGNIIIRKKKRDIVGESNENN